MQEITAIILTKNEEKNIIDCINSIKNLVKRVVVVDSGSTDNTVSWATELNAEVFYNKFEYYAKQFNWALENCDIDTDWVLRIDADERFTPALIEEISDLIKRNSDDEEFNGITMEASLYFLGKKLNYGASKKRKLMMFKFNKGKIEDRKRDAHSIIYSGYSVETKNKFIHYDFKDVTNFIDKYNYYATREKEDYLDHLKGNSDNIKTDKKIEKTRKKKFNIYYKAPMFLRAKLWYFYNYYIKLGFLDGREGQIYHYLECNWYRYLVDIKIKEEIKNNGVK